MTELAPAEKIEIVNDQGEPERITTKEPTSVAGSPVPAKGTSILSTVIQWLFILGIIVGIYFLGKYVSIRLPALNLKWWQIIGIAFSCAFVWVYVFKFGSVKPFNCVACMSGWFGLILGYWCFGWLGIIFMPLSMTVGGLYSEIRMRYL